VGKGERGEIKKIRGRFVKVVVWNPLSTITCLRGIARLICVILVDISDSKSIYYQREMAPKTTKKKKTEVCNGLWYMDWKDADG
jgi:hypothetical protein